MIIGTKFNIGDTVKVKMRYRCTSYGRNADPEFYREDKYHTGKIREIELTISGRKGQKQRVSYLVSFSPNDRDWDELYEEKQLELV